MKVKALILPFVFSLIYASTAFCLVPHELTEADVLPERTHSSFKAGEKLTYVIHYGLIDAGEAVIELKDTDYTFKGRTALHAVVTGTSLGAFDVFFKVRDRYETYIDETGIFPWYFSRRVDEGGYKKSQDYSFDHTQGSVSTQKNETHNVPVGVQDMISAFYYARTMDYTNAKVGDVFEIPTFLDDETFILKIKYLGEDEVKVREGKFNCLKFVPVVQEGRIWKDEEDLNVWISNDENKIPVLAKTKILVGSIKMELSDYTGLANPIAKID